MTTAEKSKLDYGACEALLRKIFEVTELGSGSSLADWINTKSTDFDPKHWRKPKGRVMHAVATRRGGTNSIPLDDGDWQKSMYVRAVNALPEPFPDMLRGRYHPNPTITQKFSVVHPVLDLCRKPNTMLLAKDMLDHIYSPRMIRDGSTVRPQKIWERYAYTSEEWMDADARKTWDRLRRRLREHMTPAIDAWVDECRKNGLDV